jgi:membrane-associated phospholipid phosphatase
VIGSLAIAFVAAILYAGLGLAVSHHPPAGIDTAGAAVAGENVRLALVFTESCWWEVFVTFGLAGIVVAVRSPQWRGRIVTSIVTTLAGWEISNVLKEIFRRPRPPYWHLIRETSYAYSSGHAMFAVIVYWLWAYFVWNSDLPDVFRRIVAPVLALWGWGIIWSRLALGAHYVTDLAGGVLLGIVLLALGAAVRESIAARAARAI